MLFTQLTVVTRATLYLYNYYFTFNYIAALFGSAHPTRGCDRK